MTNATIIPTPSVASSGIALNATDVEQIAARRRETNVYGNSVSAGDIYPAMIVCVHSNKESAPPDAFCNLKVMLDGPDTYWATSRKVGSPDEDGAYHWMPYQVGQAAKASAPQLAPFDPADNQAKSS